MTTKIVSAAELAASMPPCRDFRRPATRIPPEVMSKIKREIHEQKEQSERDADDHLNSEVIRDLCNDLQRILNSGATGAQVKPFTSFRTSVMTIFLGYEVEFTERRDMKCRWNAEAAYLREVATVAGKVESCYLTPLERSSQAVYTVTDCNGNAVYRGLILHNDEIVVYGEDHFCEQTDLLYPLNAYRQFRHVRWFLCQFLPSAATDANLNKWERRLALAS